MNKISTERAIETLDTVRAYYASLTAGYPKGNDCKGVGDVTCGEIANSCLMAIKALKEQTNSQYKNHILSCELGKLRDEIKTLEQRQEKRRWNEEGMKEWEKLQERKEVLEQQKS